MLNIVNANFKVRYAPGPVGDTSSVGSASASNVLKPSGDWSLAGICRFESLPAFDVTLFQGLDVAGGAGARAFRLWFETATGSIVASWYDVATGLTAIVELKLAITAAAYVWIVVSHDGGANPAIEMRMMNASSGAITADTDTYVAAAAYSTYDAVELFDGGAGGALDADLDGMLLRDHILSATDVGTHLAAVKSNPRAHMVLGQGASVGNWNGQTGAVFGIGLTMPGLSEDASSAANGTPGHPWTASGMNPAASNLAVFDRARTRINGTNIATAERAAFFCVNQHASLGITVSNGANATYESALWRTGTPFALSAPSLTGGATGLAIRAVSPVMRMLARHAFTQQVRIGEISNSRGQTTSEEDDQNGKRDAKNYGGGRRQYHRTKCAGASPIRATTSGDSIFGADYAAAGGSGPNKSNATRVQNLQPTSTGNQVSNFRRWFSGGEEAANGAGCGVRVERNVGTADGSSWHRYVDLTHEEPSSLYLFTSNRKHRFLALCYPGACQPTAVVRKTTGAINATAGSTPTGASGANVWVRNCTVPTMDTTVGKGTVAGYKVTAITATTAATPNNVQATAHGLTTGDRVLIHGTGKATIDTLYWTVTVVDPDNFTLNDSSGGGVSGAAGFVSPVKLTITGTVASLGIVVGHAITIFDLTTTTTAAQRYAVSIISGATDDGVTTTVTLERAFDLVSGSGAALSGSLAGYACWWGPWAYAWIDGDCLAADTVGGFVSQGLGVYTPDILGVTTNALTTAPPLPFIFGVRDYYAVDALGVVAGSTGCGGNGIANQLAESWQTPHPTTGFTSFFSLLAALDLDCLVIAATNNQGDDPSVVAGVTDGYRAVAGADAEVCWAPETNRGAQATDLSDDSGSTTVNAWMPWMEANARAYGCLYLPAFDVLGTAWDAAGVLGAMNNTPHYNSRGHYLIEDRRMKLAGGSGAAVSPGTGPGAALASAASDDLRMGRTYRVAGRLVRG